MLKLKRSVGQALLVTSNQERVGVRVQRVEGRQVTLAIIAIKPAGEGFKFLLGDQEIRIEVQETSRSSTVLGIDAPISVRIWRAELIDRESLPDDTQDREAR